MAADSNAADPDRQVHFGIAMEITNRPKQEDVQLISSSVRTHNLEHMPNDFCDLAVFKRNSDRNIIGGLTAVTYWQKLDIHYLWVSPQHRGLGLAKALLLAAENEARQRGCISSQLDTFDFQAPNFYLKLGYEIFGELAGFHDDCKRYYLSKPLSGR